MKNLSSIRTGTLLLSLVLTLPAHAQEGGDNNIEDNLSSYTGANAEGYLKPLQDALGSSLNSGLFLRAAVPKSGFNARLEFKAMLVSFADEDRTFEATTEDYFGDPQTAEASTIVGDPASTQVTDPSTGAVFTFPGGFDIDRFGLAVPQITVGSVYGTEVMGRYIAAEVGDNELGDVKLLGFGGRHSFTSHFENSPVDVTGMVFWQRLEIGEDFLEATALTYGAQIGRTFGLLSLYGGFSIDSIDMDVTYTSDAGSEDPTEVQVEFDKESTGHLTLGGTLKLGPLHLNGEFNQAELTGFAFGLGLGN